MTDRITPSPTRSGFLELSDERQLLQEGYEFLDEKRMLVAQEMLRQLQAHQTALDAYAAAAAAAVAALAGAVARHGLEGLSVAPPARLVQWQPRHASRQFLGVTLIDPDGVEVGSEAALAPALPSAELDACRGRFAQLATLAADLAARHTNLARLIAEYRRSERRARALENVLLPEMDETLNFMAEQLEVVDLEEALRVRFVGRTTR